MEGASSTIVLDQNSYDEALEPMIVSQMHSLAPTVDRDSGIHADNEQVSSVEYTEPGKEYAVGNVVDEQPLSLRSDNGNPHVSENIADAEHPLSPYDPDLNPVQDVVQYHVRRSSIISRISEAQSLAVDPNDELCGWGPFSPLFCQQFREPKWVLLWLSLAGVCQGMIVNGFVLNSISTLERRFDLKSSETGVIASGYDFASLVCLIPVSYFGGVARKPHWVGFGVLVMGLGSMLFMLPHFTTDIYLPGDGNDGFYTTCMHSAHTIAAENDCKRGLLSNYKYMFVFGQLLHGMGASPLYTLGVSYLDDNLLPATTSLYVAIFYSLSILGPAVGFLLGGVFLNIYTDAASVDVTEHQLTTSSPKWVGAWWVGFIIAGGLSFIVSFVLCGFPKYLPGRKAVLKMKVSEAHDDKGTSGAFSGSLKEFPVMLKKLLTNPTFVFVSLAGTMEGLILSGFATFAPKFVQNQFAITASSASIIVGAIAVPAGGGGTFFGGWIIKRCNLKLRGIVRLCTIFAVTSFFLCFGYLVQCDGTGFAGVNKPYMNEAATDLTAACNRECKCTSRMYNPVCGADNLMYFSPCHAGCVGAPNKVSKGKEDDEIAMYGNCSCIDSLLIIHNETGSQAQEEQCPSDCALLPVFLLFFFGVTVFTFLASMPALSATLRSVPENQKSFALGIQWLIVRAFGTIPAAPLIGGIIDHSCVLWQEECGEKGSCYVYDNKKMGIYLMSAGLVVKFFSVLFLLLTYMVYKPPGAQIEEPPLAEIDFVTTQEDVAGGNRPNSQNETTEL